MRDEGDAARGGRTLPQSVRPDRSGRAAVVPSVQYSVLSAQCRVRVPARTRHSVSAPGLPGSPPRMPALQLQPLDCSMARHRDPAPSHGTVHTVLYISLLLYSWRQQVVSRVRSDINLTSKVKGDQTEVPQRPIDILKR